MKKAVSFILAISLLILSSVFSFASTDVLLGKPPLVNFVKKIECSTDKYAYDRLLAKEALKDRLIDKEIKYLTDACSDSGGDT